MPHPAAAAASLGQAAPPASAAYVYCGPGAGTRSVLSALHSLREALVPAVKVRRAGLPACLSARGKVGLACT